jgi:D-proline reductase (dithiol) PrdB
MVHSSEDGEAMADKETGLGFAPEDDVPIPYRQRTREWYLALAYGNPYRWAHYAEVPFQPLRRTLSQCRATLITTAAPYRPECGNQGPGAPYNAAAKFYEVYALDTAHDHDLRIAHVSIDRIHTSMEDSGTWLPLQALRHFVAAGRIGGLAPRFFGVPTNRSQCHTLAVDAPLVVSQCLADQVEIAFLVPNCPICHQTLSLVARALEHHGVSTVLLGCAKDVVEHCGVPRMVFSDFPLGNAAGKPHDPESQRATLELACATLEGAPAARTTVQSPQRWSASADWKLDFCNVARVSPAEIVRLRAETDQAKAQAKAIRDDTMSAPQRAVS